MIKKTLNNKKGSTLIMVLMSLSVLSILGTAILSASVMNFKMKKIDMKSKQSFYLAESGLEEAYVVIEGVVETAIDEGNKKVNKKLKKELDKYTMDDGSIEYDGNLKNDMQKWFEDEYKDYINNNLIKSLYNNSYYEQTSIKVDEFKFNKDKEEFYLTLESENNENEIKKEIKVKLAILVPNQGSSYVKKKTETLTENVLWTKALLADKDIIIKGEGIKDIQHIQDIKERELYKEEIDKLQYEVEVKGDVYAYGTGGSDKENIGGIIVGDSKNSARIKLDGKLTTNRYIQTKGNNSIINITNNGEVFCNSLIIPKENTGSIIDITGDVNTYDDIELNGKDSNIYIDGSYYGFNDGSNETEHYESSGIVINNDSIGSDDSTIEITGKGKGKWYAPQYKGTFIAGTSYIELGDDPIEKKYYQTGESVSVKGNYKAYSDVYYDNEVYQKFKEKYNSDEQFDDMEYDDMKFDYFSPLVLMDKVDNKSNPLYEQRKKYLMAVSEAEKGKEILNLGNEKINIKGVKYSIGAYIDDGNIKDGGVLIDYDKLFTKNQMEYDYYVKAMGDPQQESDYKEKVDFEKKDIFKYLDIDDSESINREIEKDDYKEIIYINSNASEDFYLNGDDLKNNKAKGIIITNKNVYIYGKIDFEGTIISKGNIYIKDDKPKKFSNNYTRDKGNNYILSSLAQNKELRDLFKKTGNKTIDIIYKVENNSDKDSIDSIIKIREWKKLK